MSEKALAGEAAVVKAVATGELRVLMAYAVAAAVLFASTPSLSLHLQNDLLPVVENFAGSTLKHNVINILC